MKLRKILIIVPISVMLIGTIPVFGKTPFPDLTSNNKAQEVANKIPRISSSVNTHAIGLGVGQTVLLGDFRDHADDAINFELFYNYSASHSFDMLVNFHYSSHTFKSESVTLPGLAIGIKGKLWHIDALSPFVLAGFGFYRPKIKRWVDDQLVNSRSRITFGYHFGGGAELELNRNFSMGVMGQFHNPFDIKQEVGSDIEGWYFKLLVMGFYKF